MKQSFYPLKISDLRRETAECVSIGFAVPAEHRAVFSFKPGQHLTLKAVVKGEELRRSYSICSAPQDHELRVAIKKIEGGAFSSFANDELRVGDTLEVAPADGHFTLALNPLQEKHYLMIAAGSGITPILSLTKTILETEPKSRVSLIYGNRTRATIIFKSDLEALKNRHLTRLSLFHVLSRERAEAPFLAGRIDAQKCAHIVEKLIPVESIDEALLCGPEEMILTARDVLAQQGLPAKNIHFELFFSGKAKALQAAREKQGAVGPTSQITLVLDGVETNFDLAQGGESLLDAALRSGADLPYACKGGVCATCRANIQEGEVEMDVNYSLDEDEIRRGFVLTCQAHPKSAKVRVNFDIK